MLGLDIGTRSVKAVLLSNSGGQIQIIGYACEPIQGNAFAEREIKDFDAVSAAIRKAKMSVKSKCKTAAVAVSGSTVITKVVFMDPGQTDFEMESQIEVEADSLIPYPLDEVYLDFEEVGESKTHVGKVDVLLSAAHKDMIDGRVTLLRELELEPKVVDVDGYALGTALLNYADQPEEGAPLCCINLGASQLIVTVVQQDRVIYSKEHGFGMDNLVRDLSLVLGMDPFEVSKQLVAGELPEGWREQSLPVFVANLQQQLNRALQMYVSSTNRDRPARILISGGGANLPGLAQELEKEMSLKVDVFNPLCHMKIRDNLDADALMKLAPQLAIAVGLADRSFSPWHI
ncbi:type IV pilus assembly protein PilM [Bowmanella dokdonensis]|uniref:Type IV pilus assembly protein PilM n=2 Tax=Bowmanella dokdonensis TaxID=751969 RepID=A0A939IMH5_9ALTE|nr:type IV pilus assembly protein PilM [Bowmanella dokdonensis]MBN7823800.1 type IV pilus assembly protein PilM [Bowmanella dokdonensis]